MHLHFVVLFRVLLYFIVLHCIVLYRIVLRCAMLGCAVLGCILLVQDSLRKLRNLGESRFLESLVSRVYYEMLLSIVEALLTKLNKSYVESKHQRFL